jgi:hypothetical protein
MGWPTLRQKPCKKPCNSARNKCKKRPHGTFKVTFSAFSRHGNELTSAGISNTCVENVGKWPDGAIPLFNRLVAGSDPARGAKQFQKHSLAYQFEI